MRLLAQDLPAAVHGPLTALLTQTLRVNTEVCPAQLSVSYRHLLSQGIKTPPPSAILHPHFVKGQELPLVLKTVGAPGTLHIFVAAGEKPSFSFFSYSYEGIRCFYGVICIDIYTQV